MAKGGMEFWFVEGKQILCQHCVGWYWKEASYVTAWTWRDGINRQLSPLGKKEKLHNLVDTCTKRALHKYEIPHSSAPSHRDTTRCCVNMFSRAIVTKTPGKQPQRSLQCMYVKAFSFFWFCQRRKSEQARGSTRIHNPLRSADPAGREGQPTAWAVNTHTFGQRCVRITTALWYFVTLPLKKKPNQTEEISHQIIKRSLHNNPARSGTPVIPSPPGIPRTNARWLRYAGVSAVLLRSQSLESVMKIDICAFQRLWTSGVSHFLLLNLWKMQMKVKQINVL